MYIHRWTGSKNILGVLDEPLIITDRQSEQIAKDLKMEYYLYEKLTETKKNEALLDQVRAGMCDMDTVYILFTSGSTGMPKGTVISHRALISYINWVTEEFAFDEHTSFGSQTPLYFSMSVTDLYSTIKCGGTYHIIPKQYFSFPLNLIGFLNEHQVNTIYWVPTAISILSNWKAFDVAKPEYLVKSTVCRGSYADKAVKLLDTYFRTGDHVCESVWSDRDNRYLYFLCGEQGV